MVGWRVIAVKVFFGTVFQMTASAVACRPCPGPQSPQPKETPRSAYSRRGESMASRTKPPFRADHVGSLLRPREVLAAREQLKQAKLTPAELRTIEDAAIRRAV